MGRWQHEPTAEEVEALVAEQLRCLPPWWAAECARLAREDEILWERCRDLLEPETVSRGRGLCREMRDRRK